VAEFVVTGGAGFLGSHCIHRLLKLGGRVTCIDNLSRGTRYHLAPHMGVSGFRFIEGDVLDPSALAHAFRSSDIEAVFHFAGRSAIHGIAASPPADLQDTFCTTFALLMKMREQRIQNLVFASSAAVYGYDSCTATDARLPVRPVSMYAAAKLASEAFISAFATSAGIRSWIFRLANLVGPGVTQGILHDFVDRLLLDPTRLRVLGHRSSRRPYLHVADALDAIMLAYLSTRDGELVKAFNLGAKTMLDVAQVAEIVAAEMGLAGIPIEFAQDAPAATGDIRSLSCDVSRIESLGWQCHRSSEEAIRAAVHEHLAWRCDTIGASAAPGDSFAAVTSATRTK